MIHEIVYRLSQPEWFVPILTGIALALLAVSEIARKRSG